MRPYQSLKLQMRRPAKEVVVRWDSSVLSEANGVARGENGPPLPATLEIELQRDSNGSTGLELIELPQTSQCKAEAAAAAAAAEAVADDDKDALQADVDPDIRTSFSFGAAAAAAVASKAATATARCVAVAGAVKGSHAERCCNAQALVGHVLVQVNGRSVVGCGVEAVVSHFREPFLPAHSGASRARSIPALTLHLRKPTVAELGVFKLQQRRETTRQIDEKQDTSSQKLVRQSSRHRSTSWNLNDLEETTERKKGLQLSSDEEDVEVASPHSNTRRLELKALAEAKMKIACMTFEHEEVNRELRRDLREEKKQSAELRVRVTALQRELAGQSVRSRLLACIVCLTLAF